MTRKMVLNIDDKLYSRLEKHARRNGESLDDFFVRAVCDALDMFDDFYESLESVEKSPRPNVHFFGSN